MRQDGNEVTSGKAESQRYTRLEELLETELTASDGRGVVMSRLDDQGEGLYLPRFHEATQPHDVTERPFRLHGLEQALVDAIELATYSPRVCSAGLAPNKTWHAQHNNQEQVES